MRRLLISVAACATFASFATGAQAQAADAAPAEKLPVIVGLAREGGLFAKEAGVTCNLRHSPSAVQIPPKAKLVIVRKVECKQGLVTKELLGTHYEVLLGGRRALANRDAMDVDADAYGKVDARTDKAVEDNREEWVRQSRELTIAQLKEVDKNTSAMAKYGIALVEARVFAAHERAQSRGFEVTVFNPTNKVIKYVTINVVGLNAVGDPVNDRIRGTTTMTIKGIGPIQPDATGSYSKEMMWTTDTVEAYRITSMKVDYMDGTSRAVADPEKTRLKENEIAWMLQTATFDLK